MKVLNYARTKCIPPNAVYIGRAMPNIPASKFQNPYKMFKEEQRDYVVKEFRKHLWRQINAGEITKEDLLELDGKDLVCWCAPYACHGDVLLKAVEWAKSSE